MSIVLALVLLGGAAGCAGTDQPAAGGTGTGTATSAPADEAFPLTVTRRGGFAGVDDRAQISADGSAVVTHRGQSPVQTSLPADTIVELRRLLTDPGFADRATPSGSICNDGYEYEITSPSASASVSGCEPPRGAPLDRMVAIVEPVLNT